MVQLIELLKEFEFNFSLENEYNLYFYKKLSFGNIRTALEIAHWNNYSFKYQQKLAMYYRNICSEQNLNYEIIENINKQYNLENEITKE